jgi:hypothetical protein
VISPCYQWPAASCPNQVLPTVEDRLTGLDHGVIFWVPLDYLHGNYPGSGYWQFTSSQGYRTGGGAEPRVYLGGGHQQVVDLAAAVSSVTNRRFSHLTAVVRHVTTAEAEHRLTAPFPAYIVH